MEIIQSSVGIMKDASLPAQKKIWLKPEIEIIAQHAIECGQTGFFTEANFSGKLPAHYYYS